MRTVNARLALYQRIREIVLVDEIPVSAAGTVLTRAPRERLR